MPSSMTFRTRSGRLLPAIIVAMLLASCSGQAPQAPTESVQGAASGSSDYYLQQAQQSSDDNKADWQLLAVRALIREGKAPQAAEQLAKVPQNLTAAQTVEQQLTSAEVQVALKNYPAAATSLSQLDPHSLTNDQKARYYQAQIDASQGRTSLGVIRAYIAQESLLQGQPHQDNIDHTWMALTQLSPQDVSSIVINADENTLQGWLDLLSVWQSNKQDPDLLKAGIKDWQRRYPVNPAAKSLPTQLNNVLTFQPASTGKIALFLPMSGPAQVYGNAIQQGFNAAMNGQISQPAPQAATADANAQPQVPADPNAAVSTSAPDAGAQNTPAQTDPSPAQPAATPAAAPVASSNAQVKVYDTNGQPLAALLTQAQQDGATLVVGPLLKDQVNELSSDQTPLNVLALNQPETEKNSPNICYFALSPEDEAQDAARHMWSEQKRMPLLLVPRGNFGDRIAQAFANEWQKLGGQTVLKQGLGSAGELRSSIGSGIRLTGTPVIASDAAAPAQAQGVTIGGITIPAPPTDAQITQGSTGGAVDSVYVVATQSELTLIKPMLDLAVNGRSHPAVYASSRSYQAGAGPDYRLEMEGVQFSDIPLLAGGNPALMQQAAAKFGNDYSLVRLYAMGIDAWSLANHFSQMRTLPGFQVSGSTGDLSANGNCVIHRKLPWLQYRQGSLVPVSS
ncbi:penicillin-binding protein activator [Rahnella sp. C60]|uniref:penicillin-binding protein activator n=1 Tax=Rahnella perminowiae TaxID=2816244 RepID=UPI001C27D0B5|nr:penicillin-binding protein activator [Rahnella perminowiae]MBU9809181.1 penicillin-binding protein activator [Rahnella perminowiae]MBU9817038.1 penicillin-binding protein activator [Rahnella perminowiae]MBU9823942.1 penicillin-binding protein activator [Rahnella perminowiae]